MLIYDILLALGVILFAGVACLYLRHPAASFYHPLTIYLAMHGIVFTLRPILARIFDYRALYASTQFEPSLSDKITVLLAANLALIVFAAVSLRVASHAIPARDASLGRDSAHLWIPFLTVSAVIAPVAVYAAGSEWAEAASGSSSMILDRATAVNYNTSANGWFAASQLALAPLVAIFAWLTRFRWYSLLPFASFFLLRAGTGGRGPIIIATIAIVILYLLDRERKWPEWRSAILILLTAFAFNVIVADRGKAVRDLFVADQVAVSIDRAEIEPFEHMDFANLEYFEFAVYAVPQRTGTYDYFLHNLQIFTEPIPRIWWQDKPLGPPIAMYRLPDYGRPYGFTYSVPGVGWMAWGWPGVAIQAALFALIFGWFHQRLALGGQTPVFTLIFAMMIASTVVAYRDGTLLTVVRVMPFYIGPIVAVWALSFVMSHQHTNAINRPASVPGREGDENVDKATRPASPAERRRALAARAD